MGRVDDLQEQGHVQALRRRDRTATEGQTVSGGRTHKIRATECAKARAADTFTALWTSPLTPTAASPRQAGPRAHPKTIALSAIETRRFFMIVSIPNTCAALATLQMRASRAPVAQSGHSPLPTAR